MRKCNKCGILLPFDSSLNVPKSYSAGAICKVCYKYYKRESAKRIYHTTYDKSLRNLEPEKKICTECNKVFFSAYNFKVTCCYDCGICRKNRLEREKRAKSKGKNVIITSLLI